MGFLYSSLTRKAWENRVKYMFGIVNVSRLTYRLLMKEVEEGTRE
jgi:hypothetical protein